MQILTGFAVYFLFWWLALFLVLPIGLRTQAEDKNVVNGTVKSAPARFRGVRIFAITSILAAVLFAIWYFITQILGFGTDSIPRIVPEF